MYLTAYCIIFISQGMSPSSSPNIFFIINHMLESKQGNAYTIGILTRFVRNARHSHIRSGRRGTYIRIIY